MPVTAMRFYRKMRGGAQAHLLGADDGRSYVVKFANNPQGRRILVNEVIAAHVFRYLQISSPETQLILITEEFLERTAEVAIQLGHNRIPVEPGLHFGSCFPGDPDRMAVYDFLPDVLLETRLANMRDFAATLVVDKWMGNSDARQAIFFRARVRQWLPAAAGASSVRQEGYVAQMIDHGYMFDGPNWAFTDSPLTGLYFRKHVYRDIKMLDHLQPWLDQVTHFPEEVLDAAWRSVPRQWLGGDEDALENLLNQLLRRRKRVRDLLEACAGHRNGPLSHWSG